MAKVARPKPASLLSLDLGTCGRTATKAPRKPESANGVNGPEPAEVADTLAKIGAIVRKMAGVRA